MSLTPPGAASTTGSAEIESDPSGDPADEVTEARDAAVQKPDQQTAPEQQGDATSPVAADGGRDDADASPSANGVDTEVVEHRGSSSDNGVLPSAGRTDDGAVTDDDATVDGLPVLDDVSDHGDAPAPGNAAPDAGDAPPSYDGAPSSYDGGASSYGDGSPSYGDGAGYGGGAAGNGAPPGFSTDAPPLYGDASTYGDAPVHGGAAAYGDVGAYGSAAAYGEGQVLADQAAPPLFYDQTQTEGFTPLPPDSPVEPMTESAFAYMDAHAPVQEPAVGPVWPSPDAAPGTSFPPAPGVAPPSRGPLLAPSVRRKPSRKGRRVKRVVRRIELWSVLKVSLLVYACMYLITLAAGVLLWGFAYSAGLIENFESFMNQIGFDDFRFFGDQLFKEAAIVGAVLVVAGALLTVLGVALVNLISEVTGGVRFVVIEIDVDEPPSARPS